MSLQQGRVEGDAPPARIQLGDQGLEPLTGFEGLAQISQGAACDRAVVEEATDAAQVHEKAIGLDRGHLTLHELAHLQFPEAGRRGRLAFGEHQLAGFWVDLQEAHAKGLAHQGFVVLAIL